MGLFDDLFEPLKDISQTIAEVKSDALSAISQIGDDVTQLRQEGSSAVNELNDTIRGAGSDKETPS